MGTIVAWFLVIGAPAGSLAGLLAGGRGFGIIGNVRGVGVLIGIGSASSAGTGRPYNGVLTPPSRSTT